MSFDMSEWFRSEDAMGSHKTYRSQRKCDSVKKTSNVKKQTIIKPRIVKSKPQKPVARSKPKTNGDVLLAVMKLRDGEMERERIQLGGR